MEIYLDSANINEINIAHKEWNIISGVTTNPTLVAKEGKNYEDTIKEIIKITDCHVSIETTNTTTKGIIDDAKRFAKMSDKVVIKIPMTLEGLKAIATINKIENNPIRINATLIFSANQALLATIAGAEYVSIFVGRLDDIGHSGIGVVRETVDALSHLRSKKIGSDTDTRVIAASIRHPLHVIDAAKVGTDITTVPFSVIEKMMRHPLTDIGLENFMKDLGSIKNR